jgi:hypothetical protein
MTKEEMKRLHLTPIEGLINEDFGEIGTPSRIEFDASVDRFINEQNQVLLESER